MRRWIKNRFARLLDFEGPQSLARHDAVLYAIGELKARAAVVMPPHSLIEAEFKVFSQFGEDGIIQYLVNRIVPKCQRFIEIGVEDYRESNTRFLLMHNYWRGTIVDAGQRHLDFVRSDDIRWRHDVTPIKCFVTAENIGEVVPNAPLGLLSIDVDGNDYWLWKAVEATPEIVVIEYNSVLGPDVAVTIPYDPEFRVTEASESQQYFGASLAALEHLGRQKGYELVGGSLAGVNAFFVRSDVLGNLPTRTASEVWIAPHFRSTRLNDGSLSMVSDHESRRRLIEHLPVVDVRTGKTVRLADASRLRDSRN